MSIGRVFMGFVLACALTAPTTAGAWQTFFDDAYSAAFGPIATDASGDAFVGLFTDHPTIVKMSADGGNILWRTFSAQNAPAPQACM